MIAIYSGDQISAANAHRPSVEVFVSETERVVLETFEDYSSPDLPEWIVALLEQRNDANEVS